MNGSRAYFKKGLCVFWESEFVPAMRELAPAIGHGLELGKYLLFSFGVVLPYCFLIVGLENTKPLGKLQPH